MDEEYHIDIDIWHQTIVKWMDDRVTENGKHPHRLAGTNHGMNLRAVAKLMELAKYGKLMKSRGKGKIKAAIAARLRQMADDVEHEK